MSTFRGHKDLSNVSEQEYKSYTQRQIEKTSNPQKREKWLTVEHKYKVDEFKNLFNSYPAIKNVTNALCIAARTGQEIVALKEIGIPSVVGVDLVPCPPDVIYGDMHDLPFDDNKFDFVFSNSIDHSIAPEKMVKEATRVLKTGGLLFIHVQMGKKIISNSYDVIYVQDETEVKQLLDAACNYEVIAAEHKTVLCGDYVYLIKKL